LEAFCCFMHWSWWPTASQSLCTMENIELTFVDSSRAYQRSWFLSKMVLLAGQRASSLHIFPIIINSIV
jgi:hypothetical protein